MTACHREEHIDEVILRKHWEDARMGMTIIEKILARASGAANIVPGDLPSSMSISAY